MVNEKRLIDANALIHRVVAERDDIEIKTGCDIGYHNGLNMAVSMAINAPTVDAVEVVHGRWEEADDGDGVVCSVCRTDFCTLIWKTEEFNYCPNCGATMDKNENP